MKKLWGRKTAQAVTIIGGSDGPTSVFLAGKFTGQTFLRSLKGRYMDSRMKRRRAKVIKHLAAEPHTPKELERYLKKKYHAREYSPSSSRAKEGFKNTKISIVWREHGEDMQQLEKEQIKGWLLKKHFDMEAASVSDIHKMTGFLYRKGFSFDAIRNVLSLDITSI